MITVMDELAPDLASEPEVTTISLIRFVLAASSPPHRRIRVRDTEVDYRQREQFADNWAIDVRPRTIRGRTVAVARAQVRLVC